VVKTNNQYPLASGTASQIPGFCEGGKAAVVSPLDVVGEAAAGKLLHRQMIAQTLAAHAFFVAAGIRTVAVFQVLLFFTFHFL